MKVVITSALLVGCLCSSLVAFAENVEVLEREAKRACLSGDYTKGVAILADLFVDSNNPTYLFNQGRCYEQNIRYEEAIGRFNEYLLKTVNISELEKADAQKHIALCEAALKKSVTRTSAPGDETSQASHHWKRNAAWISTGAAVASLGFGMFEHVRYAGKGNDFNDLVKQGQCNDAAPDKGGPTCSSLANAQDTAGALAVVGYSVATLATGAALYFWLTTPTASTATRQARIRFTCGPETRTLGLTCGGRF